MCAAEGVLVEFEGLKESPAHNLTVVDGIAMVAGTFFGLLFEEVISLFLQSPMVPTRPDSSVSPAGSVQP